MHMAMLLDDSGDPRLLVFEIRCQLEFVPVA